MRLLDPQWQEEARRALRELREDPRSLRGKLTRVAGILRARHVLRGCTTGHGVATLGFVHICGPERMTFGNRVTLLDGMIASRLTCGESGELVVGDDVTMNYGVVLSAHASVRLGARVMLASRVFICDRTERGTAPIVLGDDVWIAHGATIEPGVTIGAGSVVAAGSVVKHDVPPNMLAMGNPARALSLDLLP